MPIEYSWLKVLEELRTHRTGLGVGDLRAGLDARGFRLSERELSTALMKMHDLGLVEIELLTSTQGVVTVEFDDLSHVAVTAAGLRRLAGIVKI